MAMENSMRFWPAGGGGASTGLVIRDVKNYIGVRRLRLRRICFVREQFYLAAPAQNLKRLVRFVSGKPTAQIATA